MLFLAGPAIWAVSKGPQSQFRYCRWYKGRYGTDFDNSEIASPFWGERAGKLQGVVEPQDFMCVV